jgi:hypothetical protein
VATVTSLGASRLTGGGSVTCGLGGLTATAGAGLGRPDRYTVTASRISSDTDTPRARAWPRQSCQVSSATRMFRRGVPTVTAVLYLQRGQV